MADAAEATLVAAKAEAIDGMGHTPCTDVEPGQTIVPGDHKCSVLHIEGDGASVTFLLAPTLALSLSLALALTPTLTLALTLTELTLILALTLTRCRTRSN